MIKGMADLINRRDNLKAELKQINEVIEGLCTIYGHNWRSTGVGYHGSDKGVESFKCTNCGAEKEE